MAEEKKNPEEEPAQRKRADPRAFNWKEIHDRYVREGMTVAELSGEYGVMYETLKSRAYREHWHDHKKAWREANPLVGERADRIRRRRAPAREVAELKPQSAEEDKKSLDRSHSIAIQKLELFINEAATTAELAKQIKALIDLRESDTLTNMERTALSIEIPEEYSE